MVAQLSMTGIKEKIDGIFPLKTFCLSFAALLLSLIIGIGVYQLFMAEPPVSMALTGKTMAALEVEQKIVDEPIKTVVTEEPPLPSDAHPVDEHAASPADAHTTETAPETKGTALSLPVPPSITIPDAIADLIEDSPYGSLPIIRDSDGLKPFDAYKAPFTLKHDTKGIISLVMVDYGLSDKMTDAAIEMLPHPTNFVFSPYANNLPAKITIAHSKGMEIWLGLPMQGVENARTYNMGPDAILAGLSSKENTVRLKTSLGRATGYAGIAITVAPSFPQNSQDLQSIINAVALRGLGVAQLDPHDTTINSASDQSNAPFVGGDMWLDDVLTNDAINQKLADAEKLSLQNGVAVISFHPSQAAITAISKWQNGLANKNIQLAPLTYATKIEGPAPHVAATPEPKETLHVQH